MGENTGRGSQGEEAGTERVLPPLPSHASTPAPGVTPKVPFLEPPLKDPAPFPRGLTPSKSQAKPNASVSPVLHAPLSWGRQSPSPCPSPTRVLASSFPPSAAVESPALKLSPHPSAAIVLKHSLETVLPLLKLLCGSLLPSQSEGTNSHPMIRPQLLSCFLCLSIYSVICP